MANYSAFLLFKSLKNLIWKCEYDFSKPHIINQGLKWYLEYFMIFNSL